MDSKLLGVSARLDVNEVERIDVVALELTRRAQGAKVSRAKVVKLAIDRGLAALEKEMKKALPIALFALMFACSRTVVVEASAGVGGSSDSSSAHVSSSTMASATTGSFGGSTCETDADCYPPPCWAASCVGDSTHTRVCEYIQALDGLACDLPGGALGACVSGFCKGASSSSASGGTSCLTYAPCDGHIGASCDEGGPMRTCDIDLNGNAVCCP
jgi:hypothetical protein